MDTPLEDLSSATSTSPHQWVHLDFHSFESHSVHQRSANTQHPRPPQSAVTTSVHGWQLVKVQAIWGKDSQWPESHHWQARSAQIVRWFVQIQPQIICISLPSICISVCDLYPYAYVYSICKCKTICIYIYLDICICLCIYVMYTEVVNQPRSDWLVSFHQLPKKNNAHLN